MKEILGYKQKQTKISVVVCVSKSKKPNRSYILLPRNRVVFKAPTSETYPLSPQSMDVKVAQVWQVGGKSLPNLTREPSHKKLDATGLLP